MVIVVKNEPKAIDIRGKVCPMTFVYAKINLEKMNPGELIDIILDFPPALKNIPKSCDTQKLAKLISIQKLTNNEKEEWIMRLEKI